MNVLFKQKIRKIIRCLLYAAGFYLGFFFLARFIANRFGKRVTVLTFHRIGNSNGKNSDYSLPTSFVSKQSFEEILKFLIKHYKIISLSDYVELMRSRKELPKNTIIITFDDGYQDIYENGRSLFTAYNIPVTIFLTSSFIGTRRLFWWDQLYALCKNGSLSISAKQHLGNLYKADLKHLVFQVFSTDPNQREPLIYSLISDLQKYTVPEIDQFIADLGQTLGTQTQHIENDNRMLTWDEVRELNDSGILFGSHTKTHLFLNNQLSPDILLDEISNSKTDIEKELQKEVISFAYPGGMISQELKEIIKDKGYQIALTQNPGINTIDEDAFALKRINIWEGTVAGLNGKFSKSLLAMTLIKNF